MTVFILSCLLALFNFDGLKFGLSQNQIRLVDFFPVQVDCSSRFLADSISFCGTILIVTKNGPFGVVEVPAGHDGGYPSNIVVDRSIGDTHRDKKDAIVLGLSVPRDYEVFFVALDLESFLRPFIAREHELPGIHTKGSRFLGPVARGVQFVFDECPVPPAVVLIMPCNGKYMRPENDVGCRSFSMYRSTLCANAFRSAIQHRRRSMGRLCSNFQWISKDVDRRPLYPTGPA